jgi:4-alpha-glucanotransferase
MSGNGGLTNGPPFPPEYRALWSYLKRALGQSAEAAPALMRLAWSSPAALAIAPLQDLLNLDSEARMNVPSRADGNWLLRVREDMLSSQAFQWLQDLTESSKRSVGPAISVRVRLAPERVTRSQI